MSRVYVKTGTLQEHPIPPPPPRARVLYVPTAMYALYPYSGSTPGKQCQRARADGRKRGDKLANLVGDLLALGEHDDDCD